MEQKFANLKKIIETQHNELKSLLQSTNEIIRDDIVRQNIARGKLVEFETWISCLAQSSISPDTLKEVIIIADNLTTHNKPDSNSDDMNVELKLFSMRLSQVYSKLQRTEELCANICEFIANISDDGDIKRKLQKQEKAIAQVQNNNKISMSEVVQLNSLSQLILDNETKK